jgi:hypothetical protein
MGGGSRAAPLFGVLMCPKRQMRAAYGRAARPKPTIYKELYESFLERPALIIGSEVLQVAGNMNSFFSLQCVSTVSESRETKVHMLCSIDRTEQEFVKS